MTEATLEQPQAPQQPEQPASVKKYISPVELGLSRETIGRADNIREHWYGSKVITELPNTAFDFFHSVQQNQEHGGVAALVPPEYFDQSKKAGVWTGVETVLKAARGEDGANLNDLYENILKISDVQLRKEHLVALKIVGASLIEAGQPNAPEEDKDIIRLGEVMSVMAEAGALETQAAAPSDKQKRQLTKHFQSFYRNSDLPGFAKVKLAGTLRKLGAPVNAPSAPSPKSPQTPVAPAVKAVAPSAPDPTDIVYDIPLSAMNPDTPAPAPKDVPARAPGPTATRTPDDDINIGSDNQASSAVDTVVNKSNTKAEKQEVIEIPKLSPEEEMALITEWRAELDMQRQENLSQTNMVAAKWEWLHGGIWPQGKGKMPLSVTQKNEFLESRMSSLAEEIDKQDLSAADRIAKQDEWSRLQCHQRMLTGEESDWVNKVAGLKPKSLEFIAAEKELEAEQAKLLRQRRENDRDIAAVGVDEARIQKVMSANYESQSKFARGESGLSAEDLSRQIELGQTELNRWGVANNDQKNAAFVLENLDRDSRAVLIAQQSRNFLRDYINENYGGNQTVQQGLMRAIDEIWVSKYNFVPSGNKARSWWRKAADYLTGGSQETYRRTMFNKQRAIYDTLRGAVASYEQYVKVAGGAKDETDPIILEVLKRQLKQQEIDRLVAERDLVANA